MSLLTTHIHSYMSIILLNTEAVTNKKINLTPLQAVRRRNKFYFVIIVSIIITNIIIIIIITIITISIIIIFTIIIIIIINIIIMYLLLFIYILFIVNKNTTLVSKRIKKQQPIKSCKVISTKMRHILLASTTEI